MLAWGLGDCREIRMNEQSEVLTAWASNEPKPMLAWSLGDCREIRMNERSEVLTGLASNEAGHLAATSSFNSPK